jgi:Cd2+/Zn2+-exporting ATPase
VAGLAATAQNGVLIKGGVHLEALGKVGKVYFDKTGTLTEGHFKLLHLDVIGQKYSRQKVFEHLSLMEERASHPLAQALVNAGRAEAVMIPNSLFVKDHMFLPGEGIFGVINGRECYVGNERLFRRLGFLENLPESNKIAVREWEAIGGTIGFMSIGDDGIICAYCVADATRHESKKVLDEFRAMSIDVAMLTGDKRDTALAIGRPIGLDEKHIRSELLPKEKLEIVIAAKKEKAHDSCSLLAMILSRRSLVLMCGDGVNDAPSLAAADVGCAMGAGAALALETADVTLMDSNLTKLVYSIRMGRRVINKIKQNVVFSLVVKFLVLGFAVANRASLWAAIASDVGAMILVTCNGMSLLPARRKHLHDAKSMEEAPASLKDSNASSP